MLGGSVGEFMKFLPGVTVESDLADVSGVSIRGIGGGMTSITNDGAPASNTSRYFAAQNFESPKMRSWPALPLVYVSHCIT